MKLRHIAALTLGCLIATTASAHDPKTDAPPPMTPEQQAAMAAWQKASTPNERHQQLIAEFAGTWNTKMTSWMDPSAPPQVETGKSVNTAVLGGRQLRMDYSGQFMGQPFQGMGYTGYDNVTGKYFSTWSDNMSTGLFVAEGSYDAAGKVYNYTATMNDPMQNGAPVPVRETMRVVDKDHVTFEMYETRDGKERKSMQIEYTRAK
ncbi:DUF1579 domain-containing protein [Lysobacter solisilvae (ex Woo and Kim 2020)]|uniref:DUF1579 domain-containing protein n=1 Tax=Agrilutibacter terrestris TaxID=2865112 RepID=A0A7H0FUB7_9GAMM|nr:DUF1579 domain-containing protein [Lysobacter terrestris]QNP39633.1 DUF1579 domain-containing protein [Lysobacter terrestris]